MWLLQRIMQDPVADATTFAAMDAESAITTATFRTCEQAGRAAHRAGLSGILS